MKSHLLWAAGFFAAVAALSFWARPAAAQDQPPLKIGVCDPTKILSECQEGKDVTAKLRQDLQTLNNELDIKRKQLDTQADELKLLLPTSSDYQKKEDDYTSAQADVQAWAQSTQVNMARQQRRVEEALFQKILGAISDVAKDQNLTLVLNSAQPTFPESDRADANTFSLTVFLHSSLYHDPGMDITEKVVIALDKAYSTSH